jgi:hypothetical protein
MLHCYTCFNWLACMFFIPSTYICCLWSNNIRKTCSSKWLIDEIWYDAMNLTFSDKVLVMFHLKKSLTRSSVMIYSYQNHMLFTLGNLIHMLLVITLSFFKLLWPLLQAFHAFVIKITYTPPSHSKLLHWKLSQHPSIHKKIYTPISLWIFLPRFSFKRDMGYKEKKR